MLTRRLVTWFDDRLGGAAVARRQLRKAFPDHWSFLLGEITLYCFVVLVATGIYLSIFFEPSLTETTYRGAYEPLRGTEMSAAYRSVVELSFDVRAGLVMRQVHHWAALVMVASAVAHLARVFFTGAFRKPRELNWVLGVTLMLLVLFNGFTGYSLPDDLLSGTGLRIAYSIVQGVPFVGPDIAFFVFGGEFPAETIISRLFVAHVLIVPVLISAVLGAHLAIVWRQKHTQFPGAGRTERNVVGPRLWPTYAAMSTGLFLLVAAILAALGGLFQINPVWLWGPFEPFQVAVPAQPDWYVGWVEGALRLFPAWRVEVLGVEVPEPFFPAVLLPGLSVALLYAWPFLEARVTGDCEEHHLLDRPRDRPVRTALGVATFSFYLVLFVAGANDVLAARLDLAVDEVTVVLRVLALTLPVAAGLVAHRWARALRWADPPPGPHDETGSGPAGGDLTVSRSVRAPGRAPGSGEPRAPGDA